MTEEQLREKVAYFCEENDQASLLDLFTTELELAKIEQNKFSRGDEFLWFVGKLREFMGDSTSSRYKAFESNFISQYEHKYLEYFKVIDELTKQKHILTKESK